MPRFLYIKQKCQVPSNLKQSIPSDNSKWRLSERFSTFFWVLLLLPFFILMTNCTKTSIDDCEILVPKMRLKKKSFLTSQLVVVKTFDKFKAEITACQLHGGVWKRVFRPIPAVIGEGGVAAFGEKKEGDLKTPLGLYFLGDAFGTKPLALKMDFKYITHDDKFIDDPASDQYNTWLTAKTTAGIGRNTRFQTPP